MVESPIIQTDFDTIFASFNARSICNKLNEFNAFIDSVKPNYVAITETWLNDSVPDSLIDPRNQYSIFRRDRPTGNGNPSRGGGVCLMVSNQFRCLQTEVVIDVVGVDVVCVDMFCKSETIRMIVCYRSTLLSRASLDVNNKLISCLNKLCNVKHTILLLGDFNLPNISWNTNNIPTDSIHLAFLECFFANGLTQLNNFATRGDVILDLVLCNEPNVICNLETLAPLGASDHDIISFSLIVSPSSHLDSKPVIVTQPHFRYAEY